VRRNPRICPSEGSHIKTYYSSPVFANRLVGRYTVEWDTEQGLQRLAVCTRLTDFEGNHPSLRSILSIPQVLASYLERKRRPILRKPLPFLSLEAIQFLDGIVRPHMKVLEVGAGNSTLWFLSKGVELISVEHSMDWANHVQRYIDNHRSVFPAPCFQLVIKEGRHAIAFVDALRERSLDLVLVDSENDRISRSAVVRTARQKIVSGGWMVLDNSDHPYSWAGADVMSDCERVQFTGYALMALQVSQTSFWKVAMS